MAGQNKLDTGSPQRLDHVKVLLARDTEDMLNALAFKSCDEQV
jgi:hypothetical protein